LVAGKKKQKTKKTLEMEAGALLGESVVRCRGRGHREAKDGENDGNRPPRRPVQGPRQVTAERMDGGWGSMGSRERVSANSTLSVIKGGGSNPPPNGKTTRSRVPVRSLQMDGGGLMAPREGGPWTPPPLANQSNPLCHLREIGFSAERDWPR